MYSAEMVKKAVQVLNFIMRQKRTHGVSEMSQKLGFNKSAAFGILKALKEQDLIEQDSASKEYRIADARGGKD